VRSPVLAGRPALGATLSAVLAAALLTAGCSSDDDAAARAGATTAARQLASGKLTGQGFLEAPTARRSYRELVSGLDGLDPKVSVTDVAVDGSAATATLLWSWSVASGKSWSYTTDLPLHRSPGEGSTPTWRAEWHAADVVRGMPDGATLELSRQPAQRGRILGAHGQVLVTERPVVRVGIDKEQVPASEAAASAATLARLAGIDVASYVKQVRAAGPKAFVEAIVYRRSELPGWVLGSHPFRGLRAVDDTLALAPSRDFADELLGRVGAATAEIVKASHGRVRPGDQTGVSGLQRRYDEQLAGTTGVRIEEHDPNHTSRTLFSLPARDGSDLHLTLDRRLQALADRVLAGVGPASALVAIRPSTGAVLAVSSGPGSKGYDTADFGRYAPGSTFKIVSSLALLRSGLTPRSTVPCTTGITVSGKHFGNDSYYPASGLGDIPLTLALANSCNTAYISQHVRLHGDDLGRAAAALGFGVDHEVGFPAYFGQVPAPASETEAAADMIGQGKVLASPLAMATVVSSVVAGHAVVPWLVAGHTATADPPRPLTATEARELRSMMRAVVTTPTGTGAGLADVPGPPVIAKTGTAEFGSTPPLDTHAWMVAGQGDLAVAVFVDRGKTGAGTAGPLLEAFLRGAR
jgi:cell division protein FtsI/penicillin-binding protein 2